MSKKINYKYVSIATFLIVNFGISVVLLVLSMSLSSKLGSVSKTNEALLSQLSSHTEMLTQLTSDMHGLAESVDNSTLFAQLNADLTQLSLLTNNAITDITALSETVMNTESLLSSTSNDVIALRTELINRFKDLSSQISKLNLAPASNDDSYIAVENETPLAAFEVPEIKTDNEPAVTKMADEPKASTHYSAGDTVIIRVYCAKLADTYGFEFNLNYDNTLLEYKGSLKSHVDGINTIFKALKTNYIRVGATKIGDQPGFDGNDVYVCEFQMTALADGDDSSISLNEVNLVTVTPEMNYVKNVSGWHYDIEIVKN